MGFKPSEDLSTDPFASDSDSDSISEDESNNTSDRDAENVNVSDEGECSDDSAVSFSGPDFELIDPHCSSS